MPRSAELIGITRKLLFVFGDLPLRWKSPRRIFVNSMSDLFHQDVPLEYVKRVFDIMVRAHWHQFQVLTKRADRLRGLSRELPWPLNVWQGVSIESERYLDRIDDLRHTGAAVKFLSLEAAARSTAESRYARNRLGDRRR